MLAVVRTFVLVKAASKPGTAPLASNGPAGAAWASVVKDVTSVPESVLDKVGAGLISASGMGAEFGPHGAAERRALIVALSRFGTFSGLSAIHSSTSDSRSDIPS